MSMARGPRSAARFKSKTNTTKKSTKLKSSDFIGGSITSDRASTSTLRFNRFSSLSDLDDMDLEPETNISKEERQPRPPPIVADSDVPLREIQHLLGEDCVYKRTTIGTKIFPENFEKYNFCKKALSENKIEYHSYNSKDNRLYTVFLYGLPRMSTGDIINDLCSYNLTPTSVTEVTTKYSNINDAVYKVQFTRKNFNPKNLHLVKTIDRVVVSWRKQNPKKNDKPTQCWNCLMYGHGGAHCNRRPACMTCGNQHRTEDCQLKNQKKPAVFSCFNCKKSGRERIDHSANDERCPLRAEYLRIRSNATNRTPKRNMNVRRNSYVQSNSYVRNDDDHPPLSGNITTNINNNNMGRRSYAQQLRSDNNNLFSIDELFDIFVSTLDELSKCTNKVQQIQVVMTMVRRAYDIK